MQQYTFLRLTNIFNIVTLLPKKCVSLKDAVQFHWQKKTEKRKELIEGVREGLCFRGYPQCGCRGVISKFWAHVYVGRGGPSFAYICRNHKFMILNTFLWRQIDYLHTKVTIYSQNKYMNSLL